MTSEMSCLSGGGSSAPIEYTYLPNSNKANVLASKNLKQVFEDVGNINLVSYGDLFAKAYVQLSGNNVNATAYLYGKSANQPAGDNPFLTCAYAMSGGNNPSFFARGNQVYYTNFGTDISISGVVATDIHLYAISWNASTKKARFFVDGVFKGELSYTNTGSQINYGKGITTTDNYAALNFSLDYVGAVKECESDATIIANMQNILSKMS